MVIKSFTYLNLVFSIIQMLNLQSFQPPLNALVKIITPKSIPTYTYLATLLTNAFKLTYQNTNYNFNTDL